ncbi:MAG: glycosyltransferase family 39 protein, partial [Leptolinea sp.]
MRQISQKTIWPALILFLISIFFWAARTFWIGSPYSSEGFGALGNAVYALALLLLTLILAGGLGYKILRFFPVFDWTNSEIINLSLALGLGIFTYAIFGMGLMGLLQPIHFLCLLVLTCVFTRNELFLIVNNFKTAIAEIPNGLQETSFSRKILIGIGSGVFFLTLIQTLTPPFNYDGLMYHLQGPRLILEAGRILPIYENWLTFYPFTSEMLNLFGMGLGSDIFARLIHFSCMLLILTSTFGMAQRILPKPGGALAVAILTGIPVLFLWSSQANNDLTVVLYQFLAISLFLMWIQKSATSLLILSGIMQGLAIGSKY